MLVKVEQIHEAGLKLDEPISPELLSAALEGTASGLDTGFRATQASQLKATLRRVSGGVLLNGNFTVHVTSPCKRCLKDVELAQPVVFSLNLVPESMVRGDDFKDDDEKSMEKKERQQGETGGSFEIDGVDQEVFNGKTIDLDPIVREQLLLALPMNLVCKDDCKGLCSQCGTNFNEAQCQCDTKQVDPRLASLKNIKLGN
ncbi:YceD family protein [Corallococcus terminator]